MQKVIIADTTCLILVHKIDEFDLLKSLFGTIVITAVILSEFYQHLPNWVIIKDAVSSGHSQIDSLAVDAGEASALALALEEETPLLILDDFKARKAAAILNIDFTGILGLIIEAKQSGYLNSVKPVIKK